MEPRRAATGGPEGRARRDSRQKAMHEDLMEQVAAEENLRRALKAVKRNRGAAGIDGMTTEQLEPHFARHGGKIRAKLLAGRWTPTLIVPIGCLSKSWTGSTAPVVKRRN